MAPLGKTSVQMLQAIDKARGGEEVTFVYEGKAEMRDYYERLCRHLCSMRNVHCRGGHWSTFDIGRGTLRLAAYHPDNPPPDRPDVFVDHRVKERMSSGS